MDPPPPLSEASYRSIQYDLNVRQPRRPRPRAEKKIRLTIRSPPRRRDKERILDKWHRIIRKAQMSMYKYDPIPEDCIRLMALEPSKNPKGDLQVTLIPVPIAKLHECYIYEALSYHWGESESENPVYVKTETHKGKPMKHFSDVAVLAALRLYIKDNLYEALRNLRDKKHRILVWADGICMDQGNGKEMGAQVPNMAQIYSKARGVCVWLGVADRDHRTDRAMGFIGKIVETHDIQTLIQKDYAQSWKDLIYLVTCSWFTRRWVIQEVALARYATVHCGSKSINWRDFVDAISIFDIYFQGIRKLFEDTSHEYNTITDLKPLGAKILVDELSNTFLRGEDQRLFEPIKNLELLVSTLAPFETSDPRDTIFALLNIASETSLAGTPRLPPDTEICPPTADYTKNLLQVYVDFVQWTVSSTNSLDIICRHWALPERKTTAIMYEELVTLPTWIKLVLEAPYGPTNQGLNGRKNGDSFVGLPGARCYNASHGMQPTVRFGMKSPELANTPIDAPVQFAGRLFDTPKSSKENESSRRTVHNQPKSPTSPLSNPLPRPPLPPLPPKPPHLKSGAKTPYSQSRGWLEPIGVPRSLDPSMYVRGFVLGTVSWKTSPMPHGLITKDALEKLGWPPDESDEHGSDEYGFDEYDSVPDTVWRTLVADRGPDGKLPPSWYQRACLRCLVNDTPNGHIAMRDILAKDPPRIMRDYIKRVQAVTWNRVIFEATSDTSTVERLIGVGPPATKQDDLVCILFGCSVPCVLRPCVSSSLTTYLKGAHRRPNTGEKPGLYEFVGEAFVYGKMDGQAVSGMDRNELLKRTEDFCLV